jgi:hypothetical protein
MASIFGGFCSAYVSVAQQAPLDRLIAQQLPEFDRLCGLMAGGGTAYPDCGCARERYIAMSRAAGEPLEPSNALAMLPAGACLDEGAFASAAFAECSGAHQPTRYAVPDGYCDCVADEALQDFLSDPSWGNPRRNEAGYPVCSTRLGFPQVIPNPAEMDDTYITSLTSDCATMGQDYIEQNGFRLVCDYLRQRPSTQAPPLATPAVRSEQAARPTLPAGVDVGWTPDERRASRELQRQTNPVTGRPYTMGEVMTIMNERRAARWAATSMPAESSSTAGATAAVRANGTAQEEAPPIAADLAAYIKDIPQLPFAEVQRLSGECRRAGQPVNIRGERDSNIQTVEPIIKKLAATLEARDANAYSVAYPPYAASPVVRQQMRDNPDSYLDAIMYPLVCGNAAAAAAAASSASARPAGSSAAAVSADQAQRESERVLAQCNATNGTGITDCQCVAAAFRASRVKEAAGSPFNEINFANLLGESCPSQPGFELYVYQVCTGAFGHLNNVEEYCSCASEGTAEILRSSPSPTLTQARAAMDREMARCGDAAPLGDVGPMVGPFTRDDALVMASIWPEIRLAARFEDINWRSVGLPDPPGSDEALALMSTHWPVLRAEPDFADIDWSVVSGSTDLRPIERSLESAGAVNENAEEDRGDVKERFEVGRDRLRDRLRDLLD